MFAKTGIIVSGKPLNRKGRYANRYGHRPAQAGRAGYNKSAANPDECGIPGIQSDSRTVHDRDFPEGGAVHFAAVQ